MHSNKLICETSPYLLQHAHNPVQWYAWGNEALQLAKQQDKPILVSIGYSACHWCHVMERESFENEEVAALMNRHFINIKIDREERPDLDHIYMDAVQAMTGSGGWPLNVFLTPELKPFYGGTYFPPIRAYNRASWQEVLLGVAKAFKERRFEIEEQAQNLTAHLIKSNLFMVGEESKSNINFNIEQADIIAENLLKSADTTFGGFGKAPKFPQTFSIQYLLQYYSKTKNEQALTHACLSLDKMIEGGIYDQLGGGFARYSTDAEWLAPHFEKMLYDNALLMSVLSDAYQLTKKPLYKSVIHHTMQFVMQEFMSSEFGFYSALDADSEGEEGKYYVWNKAEIENILAEDADVFCSYYDVTENGNWEGKTILRVTQSIDEMAKKWQLSLQEFENKMALLKKQLLIERQKRKRPQLDDKIILGWNALMNTACSKAFAATGEEVYRKLAIANMRFMLKNFSSDNSGTSFFHTYKNGVAKYPAFLDDYAYLIQALIHLQEITSNTNYLFEAKRLTQYVNDNFSCDDGMYYFTSKEQQDVLIRKKEIYDNATPSGNSVMVSNLIYLSIIFNLPEYKQRAMKNLASIEAFIVRYPGSFGIWAKNIMALAYGIDELAIVGDTFSSLRDQLLSHYLPFKVVQAASEARADFPLLNEKPSRKQALIYGCKNFMCNEPFASVNDWLIKMANNSFITQ